MTKSIDTQTLFDKGISLDEIGKHEEALECFNKVLEIDPRDAKTWFRKSMILKTKSGLFFMGPVSISCFVSSRFRLIRSRSSELAFSAAYFTILHPKTTLVSMM